MKLIDKDAVVAKIEKLKGKVNDDSSYCNGWQHALRILELSLYHFEVKEVDLEKSTDVDSMVTEYLKQYEEAGQTLFAMNIIGSAYRKGLEDMFKLKAQKGE